MRSQPIDPDLVPTVLFEDETATLLEPGSARDTWPSYEYESPLSLQPEYTSLHLEPPRTLRSRFGSLGSLMPED